MDFADQLIKLSIFRKHKDPAILEISPTRRRRPKSVPTFQEHKLIGKFRTTDKISCTSEAPFPKLQPTHKRSALIGTDLGTDFQSATLIQNYKEVCEQKQKHFLNWLINNQFHEKIEKGEYKKPDFICFGGRITDPMMSPYMQIFEDWKMYGAKFRDTIYLWDDSEGEGKGGHSKESYYGVYFEHIMTTDNPQASVPNELDKVYVVNEVKFGRHQLLCLNEVDAVDNDGEWVDLKVFRDLYGGAPRTRTMGYNLLKSWAQSIVPGITKFVQGSRNDLGILTKVEMKSITQVEHEALSWAPEVCYEFQGRLLSWISSHFKENDPKVVKMFSVRSGSARVRVNSEDVPEEKIPELLLPAWYVDKVNGIGEKASSSSGDKKYVTLERNVKAKAAN